MEGLGLGDCQQVAPISCLGLFQLDSTEAALCVVHARTQPLGGAQALPWALFLACLSVEGTK